MMGTIYLFMHDQTICWKDEGGLMCAPPHVRTPEDCVTFFQGYDIVFIKDPTERALPADQRRAFEKRERELRELLARQRSQERQRINEERQKEAEARKLQRSETRYISGLWKGRVAQYTLAGKLVATYNSAREASRKIGAGLTSVVYACRDPRRSSHGYQWRWFEGPEPPARIGKFIDGRKLAAQARAHRRARTEKRKEVA